MNEKIKHKSFALAIRIPVTDISEYLLNFVGPCLVIPHEIGRIAVMYDLLVGRCRNLHRQPFAPASITHQPLSKKPHLKPHDHSYILKNRSIGQHRT